MDPIFLDCFVGPWAPICLCFQLFSELSSCLELKEKVDIGEAEMTNAMRPWNIDNFSESRRLPPTLTLIEVDNHR